MISDGINQTHILFRGSFHQTVVLILVENRHLAFQLQIEAITSRYAKISTKKKFMSSWLLHKPLVWFKRPSELTLQEKNTKLCVMKYVVKFSMSLINQLHYGEEMVHLLVLDLIFSMICLSRSSLQIQTPIHWLTREMVSKRALHQTSKGLSLITISRIP